ncbi:hypothetical protein [Oryzihumus leptocrescens]|nr:hypothetical protein [Oryzihumus leptocrescens]
MLTSPRRLRAVLALFATAAALMLSTAPAGALGGSTLSWGISATRVTVGSVTTMSGSVTRGTTARTVVLQRYYSRAWHSTTTRVRTGTGRFSLRVPTGTTGQFTYRLMALAGGGRVAVATRPVVVAVAPRPVSNPKAYAFLSRQGNASAPLARWNPCTSDRAPRTIGYAVNVTGLSDAAAASVQADVRGAFEQIHQATGLAFADRGTTGIVPSQATLAEYPTNTQIVIAWASRGASSYLPAGSTELARGGAEWHTGYVDKAGNPAAAMEHGYVVADVKTLLAPGFGAGPNTGIQGTEGQLLMHELGHVMGLAHPSVADSTEIMSPTLTHKPAVWGAGDKAGLAQLGAQADCLKG